MRTMFVSILPVFLLVLSLSVVFASQPIVSTSHGKVSGKTFRTFPGDVEFYGFPGIPYAAPPLKELRFLPPQPLEPWTDVKKAIKERPPCVQFNYNIKKHPYGMVGDEDCLYLDVYTPSLDGKHPVIVFLYNINFMNTYNKTKDYAPDFFIEEGVTVVNIAHRLSILGFLSFEDEVLAGNSGLRDVIQGLKWIRDNIGSFGGDPSKITLMGYSGGAALVDLLIHSNTEPLWHAAIMQSGTSLSSLYLQDDIRERAFRLANELEWISTDSAKTLEFFKDIPTETLINKEWIAPPADYFREEQKSLRPFGPMLEKGPTGLITDRPEDKTKEIDIPVMIGFTSQEGMDASLQYLEEPRYLTFVEKNFALQMPIRLKFKFDPFKDSFFDAIQDIKDFYFNGKVRVKNVPEYVKYIGDVMTAYNVDSNVQLYANRSTKDIFYYHFDFVGELNENKINILNMTEKDIKIEGAASGDELCYLFKCPVLIKKYKDLSEKSSDEITLQKKLVRMWANFAKFGNPTPGNDATLEGVEWEPYSKDNKDYLYIGKEIEMRQNLFSDRFNFWDSFIQKWGSRAVDGTVQDLPVSGVKKDEL